MLKLIVFTTIISLFIPTAYSKYNRKDYKHWSDFDRDCQNTRAEILIRDNIGKLIFTSYKNCTVKEGAWNDFYYSEIIINAKEIDIDHVVPLKNANDIGAESWSPEKKEQFANDPLNLIVTNKKYNRQKGSKGITEWSPVNKFYACRYIKRWSQVKLKYRLPISDEEISVIKIMKCE